MAACPVPQRILRRRSVKSPFRPEDIRLLLITHSHIDHTGTTAHFKQLSGATVAVMDRDFG